MAGKICGPRGEPINTGLDSGRSLCLFDDDGGWVDVSWDDCRASAAFELFYGFVPKPPLQRITVSRSFRDLTFETYQGLGSVGAYWRLFQYLLFGAWFDQDSRRLLLPRRLLAQLEGVRCDSNYNAGRFLGSFQKDVMSPQTFTWTPYSEKRKKCRQLDVFIHLPHYEKALREEWRKVHHGEGRVYFLDGTKFSKRKETHERARARDAAQSSLIHAVSEEPRLMLHYLNNLPPHLFTRAVRDNLEQALAVAESLVDEGARVCALRTLRAIAEQPQPFYHATENGNTDRVYGEGSGMTNLKREVRKALTKGWWEADLANAQLAICAQQWGIVELQEFLVGGQKIWPTLLESLGIPAEQWKTAKPVLKEQLYAICFGRQEHCTRAFLEEELRAVGIAASADGFLGHRLIRAILEARRRMIEKVKRDGGVRDCFGKWVPLEPERKPRQLLAQAAQALEQKIVYPAYRLAQETPDFTITLAQHDGFSVAFRRRGEKWRRRISEAVEEEALRWGVVTSLEWERCGTNSPPFTI